MKVKDLIKNKDYDHISYRLKIPKDKEKYYGKSIFIGCAASKDRKLISLDEDTYEEDDTVLEYEEWSKPEENIKNGLTVVIDWTGAKLCLNGLKEKKYANMKKWMKI